MRFQGFAALLVAVAGAAQASEPAAGTFTATSSCEAFQSMRKQTNPGQVRLKPGQAYAVREVNGPSREWFRIEVAGVEGGLRWVPAGCGTVAGEPPARSPDAAPPRAGGGGSCSLAGQADSYVLAMSWQPGFCEHVKYQGRKPECDHLADGRLVVTHLTLHGLWPNRQSCGTRYGSCPGPSLDLRADTLALVKPWMPNFHYEQAFGRYEWNKHGTCTGMDDDTYFRRAVEAVRTFDRSRAGRYLAENAGGTVSQKAFQARLREETGRDDAVNAVTLLCTNQQLFEVRVQLPTDFREGGSLNELLGPVLPARRADGGKVCRGDTVRIEAGGR